MAVLRSLRKTSRALTRNPVLFVPVLILAVFQLPQLILQGVNPLLASLVSFAVSMFVLVTMPFFQAGLIAMADEALTGVTSFETFVREGKSNYLSLLGAYLLVLAVNFVIGIGVSFAAVIGGFAFFARDGSPGLVELAIIALVGGLFLLVYFTFIMFIQFYGQAIVIDDRGAVDGLRRSVGLVRQNLLSVLGYSVLVGVIGGLAGGALGAVSIITSPRSAAVFNLPEPSLPLIAALSFVIVLGGTLLGGFFTTYSVSFYRAISGKSPA